MLLYKVYRTDKCEYDQYSDFVVAAESQEEAKKIHPNGNCVWGIGSETWLYKHDMSEYTSHTWPGSLDMLIANNIGIAAPNIETGTIVCKSFHAG